MYEKAKGEEIIWRWGVHPEDLAELVKDAADAFEVIKIHGVSAFSDKPPEKTIVSYVKVKELVSKGFPVFNTPLDFNKNHRTIELPKDFDSNKLVLWNSIWNRDTSEPRA